MRPVAGKALIVVVPADLFRAKIEIHIKNGLDQIDKSLFLCNGQQVCVGPLTFDGHHCPFDREFKKDFEP